MLSDIEISQRKKMALEREAAKIDNLSDPILADSAIEFYITQLRDTMDKIKILENAAEKLKTKIQLFMRESDLLVNDSGQIMATWYFTKAPIKFDAEALEQFEPDVYKKYLKKGDAKRRFLIKDIL